MCMTFWAWAGPQATSVVTRVVCAWDGVRYDDWDVMC